MIRLLARASTLGTVAVFSNNPSPFLETLPTMAAPVVDIVGDNVVVSFQLGVRKPDPEASRLALARFGASPTDAFFVDDSLANVEGAASIGIDGFHYRGEQDLVELGAAIEQFSRRND
jgi:putative hydrolase of the HAD superfamily